MNKEGFITCVQRQIDTETRAIELVKKTESGKIYEFHVGGSDVLGKILGYSQGSNSMGIRVEILAAQSHSWFSQCKTTTLSLFYNRCVIEPVEDVDLPKYVGWAIIKKGFEKRLIRAGKKNAKNNMV